MSAAPPTHEMAYAVHTRTCTYLLDDGGVCRWMVSQQGVVPSHMRQCIGAQFVASLDLEIDGGLVAELRVGTRALFVRQLEDRLILLRSGPVQRVDDRRGGEAQSTATSPPRTPVVVRDKSIEAYGKSAGLPHAARPPSFGVVRHLGEEQTITVTTTTGPPTRRR